MVAMAVEMETAKVDAMAAIVTVVATITTATAVSVMVVTVMAGKKVGTKVANAIVITRTKVSGIIHDDEQ